MFVAVLYLQQENLIVIERKKKNTPFKYFGQLSKLSTVSHFFYL